MRFIAVYCFKEDENIKDFGVIPTSFGDYEEAYQMAVKSVEKSAELGGYTVDKNNPLVCTKKLGLSDLRIEYAIDQLV